MVPVLEQGEKTSFEHLTVPKSPLFEIAPTQTGSKRPLNKSVDLAAIRLQQQREEAALNPNLNQAQLTQLKVEEALKKYSEQGKITRKIHMRRKNHPYSSFPNKQQAKSVKFEGYVSRDERNAALDLVPEGAPYWKYYPKKEKIQPAARQVKISELPIKRTLDEVVEQSRKKEQEFYPEDVCSLKCSKASRKFNELEQKVKQFTDLSNQKREEGKRKRALERRRDHYLRMGGRLADFYEKEGISISEQSLEDSYQDTFLSPDSSVPNLRGLSKGLQVHNSQVNMSISTDSKDYQDMVRVSTNKNTMSSPNLIAIQSKQLLHNVSQKESNTRSISKRSPSPRILEKLIDPALESKMLQEQSMIEAMFGKQVNKFSPLNQEVASAISTSQNLSQTFNRKKTPFDLMTSRNVSVKKATNQKN